MIKLLTVTVAVWLVATHANADIPCRDIDFDAPKTQADNIVAENMAKIALAKERGVGIDDIEEIDWMTLVSAASLLCAQKPEAMFSDRLTEYLNRVNGTSKPAWLQTYKEMSLSDLMLDIDKLEGEKVQVRGRIIVMNDVALMSLNENSMSSLDVETKSLPREDRKFLLEKCEDGCDVTLRGTVGEVVFSNGLVAEEMER